MNIPPILALSVPRFSGWIASLFCLPVHPEAAGTFVGCGAADEVCSRISESICVLGESLVMTTKRNLGRIY
ncbi:hypothetical protein C8R44DRAFT_798276 [Mycena epipterygia]|nr:hypothetical protein C8R44DRAFT_798276 [Mycena epipterygia]